MQQWGAAVGAVAGAAVGAVAGAVQAAVCRGTHTCGGSGSKARGMRHAGAIAAPGPVLPTLGSAQYSLPSALLARHAWPRAHLVSHPPSPPPPRAGAGKTNVAMLCVLHEIGLHRDAASGEIDTGAFKIVYVAPMKALVAEMVGNFKQRLKPYDIRVEELTGGVGGRRCRCCYLAACRLAACALLTRMLCGTALGSRCLAAAGGCKVHWRRLLAAGRSLSAADPPPFPDPPPLPPPSQVTST